jgi:hypothetical protein
VTEHDGNQPKRKPRGKRAPRMDTSKKIVVRVTDSEWDNLQLDAGGIGVSTYVRTYLFEGGVRNRNVLRGIAALHQIGRRLQLLADHPDVDARMLAGTLAHVRKAIARVSEDMPSQVDGDPKTS